MKLDDAARALRREFDEAFAPAPPLERPRVDDYLAIGVGGDPYAIALAEITGLHKDWRVVPIASDARALRGIAGTRGAIVPVYDLAALLSYAPDDEARWIVTVKTPFVALAFPRFDGHVRSAPQAVSPRRDTSGRTRGALDVGGLARPIIHVAGLAEIIAGRGGPEGSAKER